MKQKMITAAAVLLIAGIAAGAMAQTPRAANSNAVFVGGTPIIRVRVGAAGYSPDQRAQQIQNRVNEILAHGPIRPHDVQVEPLGNEATVDVKGQLLFTADWATARFNHTTPMLLAEGWAAHMRRVLPSLTHPK
jgi:hypothetical protein